MKPQIGGAGAAKSTTTALRDKLPYRGTPHAPINMNRRAIDRRDFLKKSGLALSSALILPRAARAAGNSSLGPIGLQLYTVRNAMQGDLEGTLQKVASIGYKQVEFAGLFGHPARQVRAVLDRVGMTAPSMHVGFETLHAWGSELDDAHQLGCRYIVIPAIPANLRASLADYHRVADQFTRGAEAAAKVNLRFAYHNHDIDFAPMDGQLPFDVLLDSTDPKLVGMELDLYWLVRAGQDPLRYLKRWPGRCKLVHVKDSLGPPQHVMTDVGSGIIDWPQLLAGARAAGVEHFLVEQDKAAEPFVSIARSFSYLRDLKLAALPRHA